MQEIGLESSLVNYVLSGQKTIEARLGKDRFLKIREGDILSIREDIWDNQEIIGSNNDVAKIVIEQVLYFESFSEMLESLDYKAAVPDAKNKNEAINKYRQFYSSKDEEEHGIVAMLFSIL